MTHLTIISWRDIPAQVSAGSGRRATRIALSERFEQAIDRAAMKAGLAGSDDYLAQWHKRPAEAESAEALAASIEAEYDTPRLKALIDALGFATPDASGTPPPAEKDDT